MSSGVIVKGDSVDFIRALDSHIVRAPRGLVLVHDTKGRYVRKCDFYVCPYAYKRSPGAKIDARTLEEAKKYYGPDQELEEGTLDLPRGAWQPLWEIKVIRYRRRGEHADYYQHPFQEIRYGSPAMLFQFRGNVVAYRVRLPDGCVANERGFVYP